MQWHHRDRWPGRPPYRPHPFSSFPGTGRSYQPWLCFVDLLRTLPSADNSAGREPLFASGDFELLKDALPFRPKTSFFYSSGRLAGRLGFPDTNAAAAAAASLWSSRLAGKHFLTPHLSQCLAEADSLIKAVFCDHISHIMVESDAVLVAGSRIADISVEIDRVSQELRRNGPLLRFEELREKRRKLNVEKKQIEDRLGEFQSSLECILRCLQSKAADADGEQKRQEGVEVFDICDNELNFPYIAAIILRECCRLKAGLPIYGSRQKILNHMFSNQVMLLIGETGSGKSTQLVQFIADSGMAASGAVVCTQPRRIAAATLAQRVQAESLGCYPEGFVMSHTFYRASQELDSGIVFTTDSCLMQHCMGCGGGEGLAGISCIVVDEAHERSLNTDLLLAVIKKQLLKRSDLRVVIMSATADASRLAEYFYKCSTFSVTGRAHPVEIKYSTDILLEGPTDSYVSDVVAAVSRIHRTEGEGSILAFLTSQAEVEWACEKLTDPGITALPMHGKLSGTEQSLVFKNFPGKRKVVFATNIAETSLTIPGIRFVVDSGLAKESRFEPCSGMNVLKVRWISQSSARQRAGRAGRTGPGKCFRLYSEQDFLSMDLHQEPEIRKVHLGTAILRILAMGINDVAGFDFVDAPDADAISRAVQNLVHLGAVVGSGGKLVLTDTGKSLLKLGIEPRLGKMILEGHASGLTKEGVVLAAVMANSSSIFCRVGSDEEKFRADRLKVPFCHQGGDLFTLLSVYKKWEDSGRSNQWCWENSVNAKTMRRCHDTESELEACLKTELKIIVPSYWLWDPEDSASMHDRSLKRIILSSLAENLAMFSGMERAGYFVASTGHHVQLHPSSSLLVYDQKPNWVVFGEMLSLPNCYLTCVSTVDRDDLSAAVVGLFDIQHLESCKLQMEVVASRAGKSLLKRFCGRLSLNLHKIVADVRKMCSDDQINITVEFDAGEVQVFAPECHVRRVSEHVGNILEFERRLIRNECIDKPLFPCGRGSHPTFALFGSGAEIKCLQLSHVSSLAVEIFHPDPLAIDDGELLRMVDRQVSGIASVHKFAGKDHHQEVSPTKWGKILFLRPQDSLAAVSELNGADICGAPLQVFSVCTRDHRPQPFVSAIRAKICWPRRRSRGIAFVRCRRGEAKMVLADFTRSRLMVHGTYVSYVLSTKEDDCIKVFNIPKDISEAEVLEAVRRVTQRMILGVQMLMGTACNLIAEKCREDLAREIVGFMAITGEGSGRMVGVKGFDVEVFEPKMWDYTMKAMVTFDGRKHLEAAKALEHLQGRVMQGWETWQKMQCEPVFHSTLSCPAHVYTRIRKDVDALLGSFQGRQGVSYKVEQTNGSFRVKLTANATKTIADLRRPLEQLMLGTPLHHPSLSSTSARLLLTSRDGPSLLRSVEHLVGPPILFDHLTSTLRAFGSPDLVTAAESALVDAILTHDDKKPLEIHLRRRSLPSNLMKEVIRSFGPDLDGLKSAGAVLSLNTRRHVLSVRGTREEKRRVEEAVLSLAASLDRSPGPPTVEKSCPICLCEIEESYRLEDCGHEFCWSCLSEQCESAARSREGFPLRCLWDGCGAHIVLADLRSLMPGEKLEELFRATVSDFVSRSGGAYRFCPTPDCQSVYEVVPRDDGAGQRWGVDFSCGACGAETCAICGSESHKLVTCDEYAEYKADPDKSVILWRRGRDNVRSCACGFVIEKGDGCSHVECRCGAHICWDCMKTFETSSDCYRHIEKHHG